MAKTQKKRWPLPSLPYGLVRITKGIHAGRIGDYDDDADNPFQAIIYFGGMLSARGYYLVDKRYLVEPTVYDLFTRYTEIRTEIMQILVRREPPGPDEYKHLVSIMAESHQIYTEMEQRNLVGRFGKVRRGKKIFLAHSSADKGTVRMINDDLKSLGHNPWLDENAISVGESIITSLQQGITDCEFMIVCLSKNAENSAWLRVEWETKFWTEIKKQKISVLPALFEDCEIPPMLSRLRYADFRESYNYGLEQILAAIGHRQKRTAMGLLKTHTSRNNSKA